MNTEFDQIWLLKILTAKTEHARALTDSQNKQFSQLLQSNYKFLIYSTLNFCS